MESSGFPLPDLDGLSPNDIPRNNGDLVHPVRGSGVIDTHDMQHFSTTMPSLAPHESFFPTQLPNSSLFWPDSEDLLQNIMSVDPALWEQPITLMQPALGNQIPSLCTTDDLEDGTSPMSAGEGHIAIQTLSTLLSKTVSFSCCTHSQKSR